MDYISEYKKLTKLNDAPIDMLAKTVQMCADPRMTYGPHITAKMTYYANDLAKDIKSGQIFPIGSIIVKEKIGNGVDNYVNVITIMEKIKLEGKADDWRYEIISLVDGKNLSKQFSEEMPKSCIDCHSQYSDDHISDIFFSIKGMR